MPSHLYSPALPCKARTACTENPPDVVLMAGTFATDISNLNFLAGKSIFQRNLLNVTNAFELSSV